MCGSSWCTWDFTESIERVVYVFPNGVEKITYKNKLYILKKPEHMTALVDQHISDKGNVHILGKSVFHEDEKISFKSYYFIDITDKETKETYLKLRPGWKKSEAFKNA